MFIQANIQIDFEALEYSGKDQTIDAFLQIQGSLDGEKWENIVSHHKFVRTIWGGHNESYWLSENKSTSQIENEKVFV